MYYITGNEKKLKSSLYLIIKMINVEDGIRMYYDISKNQIIFKLTNSKPTEQAERCQTLVVIKRKYMVQINLQQTEFRNESERRSYLVSLVLNMPAL